MDNEQEIIRNLREQVRQLTVKCRSLENLWMPCAHTWTNTLNNDIINIGVWRCTDCGDYDYRELVADKKDNSGKEDEDEEEML